MAQKILKTQKGSFVDVLSQNRQLCAEYSSQFKLLQLILKEYNRAKYKLGILPTAFVFFIGMKYSDRWKV
jgi:hypothetical protein